MNLPRIVNISGLNIKCFDMRASPNSVGGAITPSGVSTKDYLSTGDLGCLSFSVGRSCCQATLHPTAGMSRCPQPSAHLQTPPTSTRSKRAGVLPLNHAFVLRFQTSKQRYVRHCALRSSGAPSLLPPPKSPLLLL